MDQTPAKPLLIAHRFGNRIERLRSVRSVGPDLIEADVHHYYGRFEVRHAKTLGPIPFLWDRNPWQVYNPFMRRLLLPHLLDALEPGEELMLDLKGRGSAMAGPLMAVLDRHLGERPITICSRNWAVLSHFRGRPGTRVVYSAGNPKQIASLERHLDAAQGVSIDHTLLSPALVAHLREHLPLIMTWTVNDPAVWEELESWGVNGVITDEPERLAPSVRG